MLSSTTGRLTTIAAIALAAFSVPTWSLDVTVDYGTVTRTLPANFHGLNYTTFWDGLLGSAGSNHALKQTGVELLRFPGGEPANWFDWGNPGTYIGVDSMYGLSKVIGARMLYQTDPTYDTVIKPSTLNDPSGKHQKDLVNYCKTHNIDVAAWEIGNEPDMHGTFSQIQWYYDKFNEQADSIHAADPAAIVMGPAVFSAQDDSGWIRTFESKCGTHANAVSIHWYPAGGGQPGWTDTIMMGQAYQWVNKVYPMLHALSSKPLYITEWSLDKNPSWYHVGLKLFMSVAHADVIGAFAKTGVAGHTLFGSIHCITDSWGILASNGCGDGYVNGTLNPGTIPPETPSPDYFMITMWEKMGKQVLNATHTADSRYVFNAWAHKKPNGSVQVMLINKDTLNQQSINVKFTGFNPTGRRVDVYEMYKTKSYPGDRIDSIKYNGVTMPFPATATLPAPISGGTCTGTTYARTIPPLSITVLDFVDPNQAVLLPLGSSARADRIRISGSGSMLYLRVEAGATPSAVQICNASGRVVYNLAQRGEEVIWNTAGFATGLYFVRVHDARGIRSVPVTLSR